MMISEDDIIQVKGVRNLFGDLSEIDFGFYLLSGIAIPFGIGLIINRTAR
jgi:hypothetical protein